MKRTHVALLLLVVIFFLGCEGTLTQPGVENQSDFNSQTGSLAKITIVAELDATVPTGTIYGTVGDTTGTAASGGESLVTQKWTDNRLGNFYEVHINGYVKVTFPQITSVTVDSPVYLEYLSSSDTWIGMLYSGTVSAKAIWTDSEGSGSLTLSSYGEYEEEDTH